ncbi:MAG TPA: hypothetical protein VM285_03725 [Polyangia bacterium]|nr:hypothetical protein [Polyangia bacterium]
MLAIETGWTPAVIAALPATFRSACHWALYARTLVGPDGLPSTRVPASAAPAVKMEAARLSVQVAKLREFLYPEDDDV